MVYEINAEIWPKHSCSRGNESGGLLLSFSTPGTYNIVPKNSHNKEYHDSIWSIIYGSISSLHRTIQHFVNDQIPFHQRSRSLWLKSCENPFCGDSDSCDAIRSQFCTGHDSSVVVNCAKLWPDSIIIFKVKTTGFFFQNLDYELKNPCGMVLDPGYCCAPFGKHALCLWNIWSS